MRIRKCVGWVKCEVSLLAGTATLSSATVRKVFEPNTPELRILPRRRQVDAPHLSSNSMYLRFNQLYIIVRYYISSYYLFVHSFNKLHKDFLDFEIVFCCYFDKGESLSLIHICRCRRYAVCRSRWSPYH
eukprot:TRINITY_DN13615_c0_g1_i14.p1 TRINITY_DN13615_c0_g1~~TRINITY_DN13615_c0_g1_i14.p1  ORF type:complete len:130 (+),score=3.29 TRINITY_DN13615_c0_g1_i14:112-501(+)